MNTILIRKAKKGDGKKWAETWNEGIKRKFFVYTGGNVFRNKEDIIKSNRKYSRQKGHEFIFFAIDHKNGKIVGSCSSSGKEKGRLRHRAEVGWAVHPDYANKGIATALLKRVIQEAKKRGIKRLEAEAALENKTSIRLAKKCGFKIEGKRRKGLLTDDGRYIDTYLFGKVL